MAEKTVTVCDVFGTTNGVKKIEVTIQEFPDGETAEPVTLYDNEFDMSPRATERLFKFLGRATQPPKKKD